MLYDNTTANLYGGRIDYLTVSKTLHQHVLISTLCPLVVDFR
jgi:exonuclease III